MLMATGLFSSLSSTSSNTVEFTELVLSDRPTGRGEIAMPRMKCAHSERGSPSHTSRTSIETSVES